MEYTKEDWAKWYAHKSNKELWIEAQEREEENKDKDDFKPTQEEVENL